MSSAMNESGDAMAPTGPAGHAEPGVPEEERLRAEMGARPLGEVGVLPLGGEIDPSDSAEQAIGEVGQLPGVPIDQ